MNTRRVVLTRAALEKLQGRVGVIMKLTEVIRRPIITEKTTLIREDGGTLVFQVAMDANKIDVRRAVETLFGSKVASVRTSVTHGKMKRQGQVCGPALGLEKGVREAAGWREASGIPAGGIDVMPIRKFNPTSPGSRFKTVQTFDEITTSEPYRPLTEKLNRSGGRNNQGHLTSWWRGGGHKRLYRIIDFKRDKKDIPGKVSTVEYDPNRLGADRAHRLCGRREAVHPAAAGRQGRRYGHRRRQR